MAVINPMDSIDSTAAMVATDWLVTDDGTCIANPAATIGGDITGNLAGDRPYRLYRFLTELEDLLAAEPNDAQRLQRIFPLVRRLLSSSWWLQGEYQEPSPTRGWSVQTLYEEPNFPLTVQTVVWLPGQVSPIHNHGAWGVVAIVGGQERNVIWQRAADADRPDRLVQHESCVLTPGDMIGLTPGAIHHVEVLGDEPTISFNLYGATNYDQRWEFDPIAHTAKSF